MPFEVVDLQLSLSVMLLCGLTYMDVGNADFAGAKICLLCAVDLETSFTPSNPGPGTEQFDVPVSVAPAKTSCFGFLWLLDSNDEIKAHRFKRKTLY